MSNFKDIKILRVELSHLYAQQSDLYNYLSKYGNITLCECVSKVASLIQKLEVEICHLQGRFDDVPHEDGGDDKDDEYWVMNAQGENKELW